MSKRVGLHGGIVILTVVLLGVCPAWGRAPLLPMASVPGCGAPDAGDCFADNGTPYCDIAACCEAVCAADAYCCTTTWDAACAEETNLFPDECSAEAGCGSPGTGDCLEPNGSPYCEDADCCLAVCGIDAYCCDTEWDALCAAEAGSFPDECGGSGTCVPDFSVVAPGEWTGSTCGATNDCAILESEEHVYEVFLPEEAVWIFSLCGSSYDTYLLIGSAPGLADVATNDDSCDLQSEVEILLEAGTYYVGVEGYATGCGNYTLTIGAGVCDPPPAPHDPDPADEATQVPLDVDLCWDGGEIVPAYARPKLIYGSDDRLDEYEVIDQAVRAVGDSTVALVSTGDLADNGNGTYSLPSATFAAYYQGTYGRPLCADERFRDQPNPAFCSGFLVAPDVMATAGHCIRTGSECAGTAFVFGFVMQDATTPVLTVPASDVYFCDEIIGREEANADWGLIRLDRPVTGHEPVPVRMQGTVSAGEQLVVVGHPVGLPRKYAGGATVRDNGPAEYFQANLDTYGGNSGSAVFNLNTLQVEGILVRGNTDFAQDGACDRSNVCPDTGCPNWEDVTRATAFSSLIPAFDVYFGECGPNMVLQGTTTNLCWPVTSLAAGTTYCWQVVARNHCPDGETAGPVWQFTTQGGEVFLTEAVSRKSHGLVDEFDIDLPIDSYANAGIESRAGGPTRVLLTLSGPAAGADVQASAGSVDAVVVNGSEVAAELSGVPNASCLTLTVSGVPGLQGATSVHVRVLAGDVNADGTVNVLDLVQVRNQLNLAASASNFRADVTADGTINVLDLVQVRNRLNTAVACP